MSIYADKRVAHEERAKAWLTRFGVGGLAQVSGSRSSLAAQFDEVRAEEWAHEETTVFPVAEIIEQVRITNPLEMVDDDQGPFLCPFDAGAIAGAIMRRYRLVKR